MEPPDISTFKFPNLLGTNFFCFDFFDEDAEYNHILSCKKIDFIIGNPPWGSDEPEPMFITYMNKRKIKEGNVPIKIDIGNKEIAQGFLLRSSDFSTDNTKCALIVTSKVLYNLQSADFRKYFLHNYIIERVFELAPVRRDVFADKKAIAPACVLFFNYAKGKETDNATIEHITLKPSRFFFMFKIFSINYHDFQDIKQKKLKENDWLWKVLVYGSYLDFNFINRLNSELEMISDILKNENLIFQQGLKRKDGNKQIMVPKLKGKPFLDTKKKQLRPFLINESVQDWDSDSVGYIFKNDEMEYDELFKPFSLLITGGSTPDFISYAAINHFERVFTSSVRAIKIKKESQLGILYSMNTLLCSSLFAYYAIYLCSSVGIERDETQDEEIKSMWYLELPNIIDKAKKIENHEKEKIDIKTKAIHEISVKEQCDSIVIPQLKLSDLEKSLIDYANEVVIPIQQKQNTDLWLFHYIKKDEDILQQYASLFIDRFSESFNSIGKRFVAEIWYSEQIIGMFFKVIPVTDFKKKIVLKNTNCEENTFISKIIELGHSEITDKLFIQNDIRGFEEDFFYIFKPNERRLWHKGIGYLDLYEFLDAIMRRTEAGL